MILCIAGSRSFYGQRGRDHVRRAVSEALKEWGLTVDDITEGVSGMARGADKIGYERFKHHGIPVKEFPAAWDDIDAPGAKVKTDPNTGHTFNSLAGLWRNTDMAKYLAQNEGRCVIVYDKRKTHGSQHMFRECQKMNVATYEYIAEPA